MLSQAVGAGDQQALRRGIQRGVLLIAMLTVPAIGIMTFAEPALTLLRQPEHVIPTASKYALITPRPQGDAGEKSDPP